MAYDDILGAAAVEAGIQQDFWDIFGRQHFTSPEINRAILSAIGVDCTTAESITASTQRLHDEELKSVLPAVLVVPEGSPISLPITAPEPLSTLSITIEPENGQKQEWTLQLDALRFVRAAESQGTRYIERSMSLPVSLPAGYHVVKARGAKAGGDQARQSTMRLIVTPERAHMPAGSESGRKHAGLGVMLYGIRSKRNWGCGDFRDLRDLIDWAVPNLRVDFIALNPLHAISNRRPFNTSPYLPASVFWRNFLYLDIEAVPGYDKIREQFETAEAKDARSRLRDSDTVEYEDVAALKHRALSLLYEAAPPSDEALAWIAGEGDLLRLYATWCALDAHLHAENPELWVWTDWPEQYRDPSSDAVAQFTAQHEREIRFHGWVQWLIDQQIGEVQRHARDLGMAIGLYHDQALATDRCGADLWAHRDFYVAGCRVGAPPDDFSPTGQDWSFPPPASRRHRADGYRLYVESIRKALRHGGALRIDHVMRLFRLYWIPEGHDAAHGAYVREPAADLVGILALESSRNKTVIVGEDLGTVEPEVRAKLSAACILSYRLLYFERNGEAFKLPGEYPRQALAATTTHDLPTIEGFWCGADIEARRRTGMIDQAGYEGQQASRNRDKQALLNALFAAGLLPNDQLREASQIPELTPQLHHAIVGYLASTSCLLWLVNQEDMTRERDQQNLPGTTAQYPNWSTKMRWSLEDLAELREARDCAAMVRRWIEQSGRAATGLTA